MSITSPRSGASGYRLPPLDWYDPTEWLREVSKAVRGVMDGKINATGSITLTASSATTTLSDRRIGAGSVILFMPTTANALADMPYVTGRADGVATLNHANNAQTDRTFDYSVLG